MDKGSYLVFAQEFAQGSKKLVVSRTEITERRIRRRETRPRRWMPLTDLPGILSVISVLLTLNFFEPCANSWAKTKYEPLSIGSCKLFICQKLNAPNFRR